MTPCIEYPGCKDRQGYGKISRRREGKLRWFRAHRLAYEEAHGPIPEGLVVMHACDNPPCINVEHLSLGTRADNVRDMVSKGRNRHRSSPPKQPSNTATKESK